MTVWVEESLRHGMEVQSTDGTAMLTSTLFGRLLGIRWTETVTNLSSENNIRAEATERAWYVSAVLCTNLNFLEILEYLRTFSTAPLFP